MQTRTVIVVLGKLAPCWPLQVGGLVKGLVVLSCLARYVAVVHMYGINTMVENKVGQPSDVGRLQELT